MDEARRGEIALFCNGDDYNLIRCIEGGKVVLFVKERTCKNLAKNEPGLIFKCSECGFVISCGLYYTGEKCYCPKCGAKVINDES